MTRLMKIKNKQTLTVMASWLLICGTMVTAQDIVPGTLWPDNKNTHINAHGGGMLMHEGQTYWFGEHKIQGRQGNKAQVGVHCYSSPDLSTWTDRGIALAVSNDPDSDIVKGSVIERPKVIFNKSTQKFVMWFHLELKGQYYMLTSGCTGWAPNAARLAVADSIWGPWKALGNPCKGINPENDLGPEKTFGGQSTYVLPVPGKTDAFIAMFDMWRPLNPVDGRYIWLPIRFMESGPHIVWQSPWNLTILDQ